MIGPLSPAKLAVRSALVVLVAGFIWVGCSQDQRGTNMPTDPAALLQQGLRPAMQVQERHTEDLLARPSVVGTAVGLSADGQPVIRLFTTQSGVEGLPSTLEGYPVEVEVTGMFFARTDPTARQPRPVPIGVSVGHPDISAGTIGSRVTNGSEIFILSNNHILANSNDANIGDPALQPGPSDGGSDPDDRVGELSDFVPIDFSGGNNEVDAAIAETSSDLVGTSTPSDDGYGTPSSTTVNASVGMAVQKYGRTTGLTKGEVNEINVTVDVCYSGIFGFCFESARFVGQISVTPGDFSDGGDSGSLIVTDDANKNPVGLLFAGSSSRTLANPIDAVLDAFGVTVDDGSGEPPPPPPPAEGEAHVGDLDSSSASNGSFRWQGTVTILVHDENHDPVDGATVSGTFSRGGSGSCTTGGSGSCSITSGNIFNFFSSVTFTVDDVSHSSLDYNSSANHDPDGDSDGSSITVNSPS